MKKYIVMLVTALVTLSINTKAKAGVGVLENKEYNKHELAEFQQALLNKTKLKSGIITITQANMIEVFKKHIGAMFPGENFEDVVKNSTVETLPADFQDNHKVGYIGADNTGGLDWFSRPPRTELGAEEGLKYKGKFWASKYCWNPISPALQPNQITYTPPPQQNTGAGNSGGGNTNTININPNGSNISWNDGIAIHKEAVNEAMAIYDHATITFMAIQKSGTNCSTCGTGQTQTQVTASMPVQYVTAQPQAQQVVYTTGQGGNKVNPLDVINTVANVAQTTFYGINTFRGYRLEGVRSSYSNSSYYGNGGRSYYGSGGPVQGGLNSSGGGVYSNGGGYNTGGGNPSQGQGPGFSW